MSVISGRIPSQLEQRIRTHMVQYANNITSVLSKFPSQVRALRVCHFAPSLCVLYNYAYFRQLPTRWTGTRPT